MRKRRSTVRRNPPLMPNQFVIPWWHSDGPDAYIVHLMDKSVLRWVLAEWPHRNDYLPFTHLGAMEVATHGLDCSKDEKAGAVVGLAAAVAGWGPLLYDFAALVATEEYETIFVSDRQSVSSSARGVWQAYQTKRPDVRQVKLDKWNCAVPKHAQGQGIPEFGIQVTKTNFSKFWGENADEWLGNTKFEDYLAPYRTKDRDWMEYHLTQAGEEFLFALHSANPDNQVVKRQKFLQEKRSFVRHYDLFWQPYMREA